MIHTVKLPLPPTLNEQIRAARANKFVAAKQKKEWTEECAIAFFGCPPVEQCWIAFEWRVKNFGRDTDNISASAKFIFDGMVAQGIIRKDSLMIVQEPVIHFYKRSKTDEVIVSYSDRPIYTVTLATEENAA